MLVDHRRFRSRAAKGGARGKDKLEVFLGFLVAKNPLGDLEQPTKFDQGRHRRTDRSLENVVPTHRKRSAPRRVSSATPRR